MTDVTLGLFEAFGIELEYMIVDAATLNISPSCDRLLETAAGEPVSEFERGEIGWSNELVLHVLEFKTNGPRSSLAGAAAAFAADTAYANELLQASGLCLLGGAMHPWMDPHTETRLWPHEQTEVYHSFDRIFDCRGHGWSNLQSMHINLPFAGDTEFRRLHTAIRIVLPLLPGLAASSPIADGEICTTLDTRLIMYAGNCARIPAITGHVVPEHIGSMGEYQDRILQPIYDALAPHDATGVLRHEWANARGAIARFERMAIEIRVLDVQECPVSDLAIAELVIGLVRLIADEQYASLDKMAAWPIQSLKTLLDAAIVDGERCEIDDRRYLAQLGIPNQGSADIAAVWENVADRLAGSEFPLSAEAERWTEDYLREGTLARRIRRAVRRGTRTDIERVYRDLVQSMAANRPFSTRG